jgi:hypothetical protein
MQVYMLLLGVTAMSLLTTPVVIMGSIRFLAMAKEGHQIYITGRGGDILLQMLTMIPFQLSNSILTMRLASRSAT